MPQSVRGSPAGLARFICSACIWWRLCSLVLGMFAVHVRDGAVWCSMVELCMLPPLYALRLRVVVQPGALLLL